MQVSLILVAALATAAHAKPACRKHQKSDRVRFSAGDHAARACFEAPNACYLLELDGGTAQWRNEPAGFKSPSDPEIQMHTVAKSCRDGTCHAYVTPDAPLSFATVARSPDAVVASFDSAMVVFDAATGAERGRAKPAFNLRSIEFFADRFIVFDQDTTRLHEVATGKQLVDFGKPMGASLDLGDGTIAISNNKRLDVMDRSGRIVHTVEITGVSASFVVRSRDKRILAFDSIDDVLTLVDTTTWTVVPTPPMFCP